MTLVQKITQLFCCFTLTSAERKSGYVKNIKLAVSCREKYGKQVKLNFDVEVKIFPKPRQ